MLTHYRRNAGASLVVFVVSTGLVYAPRHLDLPLTQAINSYAGRSAFIDKLNFDLETYFTFSGVVLIALIWGCCFGNPILEMRERLLVGTIASLAAGIISRFLQHALPSHPRPYDDRALGFHLPGVLAATPLITWNSFPSDHMAVFAGLVAVIYLSRPRLGLGAIAWTALVEASRTYMGRTIHRT